MPHPNGVGIESRNAPEVASDAVIQIMVSENCVQVARLPGNMLVAIFTVPRPDTVHRNH